MQKKKIKDFNYLVQTGFLKYYTAPCLCGNSIFDLIASVDRYLLSQKTVVCINCGLVQSNPRMDLQSYQFFYSSDIYREIYTPAYSNKYFEETYYLSGFGNHIFDSVKGAKCVDRNIRVLEVGSGGGWNLIPFLSNGAHVLGIDYSRALVKMGIDHGINLKQGGIDEIDEEYDIIILNHVVEHFLDPVTELKKIVGHLREDGILYIGVPNILNFSMGQLQNAHTYYFTPKLLLKYCELAGVEKLELGEAQNYHMYGLFGKSKNHAYNFQDSSSYMEVKRAIDKHKRKIYLTKFLQSIHLYPLLKKIYHNLPIKR